MRILFYIDQSRENMEVIINAEWENETKELLRSIVKRLSQGLNLESLDYIIIPKDFPSELFAFQREKGLREEYTRDELGTAAAKTLSYFKDGGFTQSIFLDSNKFFLDPAKSEDLEVAVFLINHELCHIHDGYTKYKTIGWCHKPQKNLSVILKNRADDIWSEYIANRLALRKINVNGNLEMTFSPIVLGYDLSLLLDRIPLAKNKIEKSIFEYRYHANINQLLEEVIENASQLLKATGRLYGHIHGLNLFDTKQLNDDISKTYFKNTWDSIGPILQELYKKYPYWSSSNELNDLSEIVLKTWNIFGIFPRDTNQGIYVDVPFQ